MWTPEERRARDIQEALSAMLDRAKGERRVLNSVLELLFPATQGSLGRSTYGPDWNAAWMRERRVACEEVLRVYLQAGLDEGTIPSHEIQEMVEALTDDKKLRTLIDHLDEQRFEAALERLEDFEHDFPVEAAPIAVPMLVNRMGRLSDHSASMFGSSPRLKASRVIYRLLRRIEEPEALMSLLPDILGKVDTLSGCFHLVEMVGHRESIGHRLVGEDQARMLEAQLIDRLKSATTIQLTAEWDLATLSLRVLLWIEGEDKAQLAASLRQHLAEEGFVLTLLHTAVNYAYYNGHAEKRVFWDGLVEVFGEGLADSVDKLLRSPLYRNLPKEDQDTINLAQRYASGWRPPRLGER